MKKNRAPQTKRAETRQRRPLSAVEERVDAFVRELEKRGFKEIRRTGHAITVPCKLTKD
jgi:acetolactate synthase small subunit